jgi:hypothetical protein
VSFIKKKKPYYQTKDYYRLKSSKTLTILSHFRTYQQTTHYTCGPSVALMVAEYYGVRGLSEIGIAQSMRVKSPKEVKTGYGTSAQQLVSFFTAIGFDTLSGTNTFESPFLFRDWAIRNLKTGTPIMVDWADWGGHWQIIVGYDKFNEGFVSDDVIIFADPCDTTDHKQDGYYIFSAERFFYMWFDSEVTKSHQQWVIAKKAGGEIACRNK